MAYIINGCSSDEKRRRVGVAQVRSKCGSNNKWVQLVREVGMAKMRSRCGSDEVGFVQMSGCSSNEK